MRLIIIFIFNLFLLDGYAQEQFGNSCQVSKVKLENIYFENNRTFYVKLVKRDGSGSYDGMLYMINQLESNVFQQICINTWHEYTKGGGLDELYISFSRKFKNIPKYEYDKNIVYYECLKYLYTALVTMER